MYHNIPKNKIKENDKYLKNFVITPKVIETYIVGN